jgi:adenylate kinase
MVKKNKLAIIIVGAPGSGKGTQGELLEKNTGYKRYVMSDLIRKSIKKGSEIYEKINSGILLSNSDTFEIFRKNFKKEDNIIIDGIPRTLDQAYWLYGFLVEQKYIIEVIYLEVDEKKLINRIIKRGRKDDNPKIFKHRLKEFDKARDIILDVYNDEIIKVNGDRKIEVIEKDILKRLERKNKK